MKLKIAVPTRGSLHYTTAWFLLEMQRLHGASCIINKNIESVSYNRNTITKFFLLGDETHLLFLDDDTTPPYDLDLDYLMKLDKDVLALPYPLNMNNEQGSEYKWSIFPEQNTMSKERGKGLQKIYAAGTGFMLIHRRVLDVIPNPFTIRRGEDDSMIKAEDYTFCERVTQAGFEIWTDWDKVCSHHKDIDMLELV